MGQDTPSGLSAKVGRLRLLNVVLMSLDLGYALAFAFRTYLAVPRGGWLADLLYGSVNRFFHQGHWSYFGLTAVFVGTMLLTATTVLVLLSVCLRYSSPSFAKFLAGPLSCLLALGAVPTFWISSIRIGWPPMSFWDAYPDWLGGHWFRTSGVEVIFVFALLYGIQRVREAFLCRVLILSAHYIFWAWYMWQAIAENLEWQPLLQAACVVGPGAALAWLVYVTALQEENNARPDKLRRDLACVFVGIACGQCGRALAYSLGPLVFLSTPMSSSAEDIVSTLAALLFLLFEAVGFILWRRLYHPPDKSSWKRVAVRTMIWITTAWVWFSLLLHVLIPVGAFPTHEQEGINWATATREESVNAVDSSIRYTYRIEMLSALALATLGYGVCMALKSRCAQQDDLPG